MDLGLTPPNNNSPKSPDDSETDTPPHTAQPIKSSSYTNGAQKNHHHHHHPPPPAVAYKECMKNHAAPIGGHAVDGCGEFMSPPAAAAGGGPASLKCAACGCHRSFHRREPDSPTAITPPFLDFRHPPLPKRFSLSPPPLRAAAGVFFGAGTAEEHHQAPVTPTVENPAGRKRFRTRFSQEQKEKMQCFAAGLGWKLQKSDEAAVRDFCHEIGVTKGVLKVWMHNNKNTFGKKETNNGGLIGFEDGSDGGHFQNNGSSSSP